MAAWRTGDSELTARIATLCHDLERLAAQAAASDLAAEFAWDRLFRFAHAELGLEAQEFLVTLLLEPYGDVVDDLADAMAEDESPHFWIEGSATLATLGAQIDRFYSFAFDTDFATPAAQARFWYVSEEKLEPRLGERALEEGGDREQPLAVARDVVMLRAVLAASAAEETVASFLARRPDFRHTVRRVQLAARRPFAEIRDNLVSAAMRPIDILRCKLSFFGATDFDPRSDRWVRVALYRHAPFPDELNDIAVDDWAIPPLAPVVRTQGHEVEYQGLRQDPPAARAGYSRNELEAQVRKAVRGAGLPWGLAEEAGKAARLIADFEPGGLASTCRVSRTARSGPVRHHRGRRRAMPALA